MLLSSNEAYQDELKNVWQQKLLYIMLHLLWNSLIIFTESKSLQLHMEDVTFTKAVSSSVERLQEKLKEYVSKLKYKTKLSSDQVAELSSYMEFSPDISKKWR